MSRRASSAGDGGRPGPGRSPPTQPWIARGRPGDREDSTENSLRRVTSPAPLRGENALLDIGHLRKRPVGCVLLDCKTGSGMALSRLHHRQFQPPTQAPQRRLDRSDMAPL
jgi:hypothetical protein